MYHANGKQRGTAGNYEDLTGAYNLVKTAFYQGERLAPADAHNPKVAGSNPAPATR